MYWLFGLTQHNSLAMESADDHMNKRAKLMSSSSFCCDKCASSFDSRNKLFKHLPFCDKSSAIAHASAAASTMVDLDTLLACSSTADLIVYCIGGRVRGKTLRTMESFSFRRHSWQNEQHMCENRGSHTAAALSDDGLLFAIGGGGIYSNLNGGERYDAVTKLWTCIAPMNQARHAHSSCTDVVNRQLYIIGGWVDGTVCTPLVERYCVASNKWTNLTPLSVPRKLFGSAIVGGCIYSFGGNVDKGFYTKAVEMYCIATNAWSSCVDLPLAGPTSAVAVGDKVWVFVQGRAVVCYDPQSDSYDVQNIVELPLKEWFCFDVACFQSIVLLTGGACQGHHEKIFYMFDTVSRIFIKLPDMYSQRRRCATCVAVVK